MCLFSILNICQEEWRRFTVVQQKDIDYHNSNLYFAYRCFEMQFYSDQFDFFIKRPEKNKSEESSDW